MMQLPEPRDVAPRLASGAFILNAGLTMWKSDREAAEAVHGMASAAYPFLAKLPPERFTRLLAASEIAVGAALLAPFVPTRLAGVALTGFAGGLVGLYLRLPGMHRPGSLRPTQDGLPLAKDAWLLGMGLGFLCAPCGSRAHRGHRCRHCHRGRRCHWGH
ncbi:membrane protein [Streptomyces noursei ZPM]|uniref:DoxX family protein n=1 Tax=Streptomyces noursei TaxID=1971 RepID=A0A401R9H9_STRNR|nr:hypothetical protein [Streptomyces noursei]AKA06521.1 membrane protein [Streptomyces noursei ZPM]EOS99128.1 hypothetical protein K530_35493 [Streptomyces noursei CCRC 11814]EXU85652.1 membrane protein [Streptomyces noursei PD-1]UWS75033.1 hypothetical protein N1H47_29600 [Streptomyces noursei]GCB94272.1 hypothetical protein SALB_07070 [Streptomyces noursei]